MAVFAALLLIVVGGLLCIGGTMALILRPVHMDAGLEWIIALAGFLMLIVGTFWLYFGG